jgi:hypothetical protein
MLATALNAMNLVLVLTMLPETRARSTTRFVLGNLNPLAPIRWAFGLTPILPLLGMFALFCLIGNIPGTVWVLHGQDKYQWMMVGLSLAAFGAWHAGSQAFLTGSAPSGYSTLPATCSWFPYSPPTVRVVPRCALERCHVRVGGSLATRG